MKKFKYSFLLRSRRYSYTMATWIISMPVAVFAYIVLRYSQLYDFIYKSTFQRHWTEWLQEYYKLFLI